MNDVLGHHHRVGDHEDHQGKHAEGRAGVVRVRGEEVSHRGIGEVRQGGLFVPLQIPKNHTQQPAQFHSGLSGRLIRALITFINAVVAVGIKRFDSGFTDFLCLYPK